MEKKKSNFIWILYSVIYINNMSNGLIASRLEIFMCL